MNSITNSATGTTRRLSLQRLALAIFILFAIIYTLSQSIKKRQQTIANKVFQPWFGAYVDVTSTPQYAFEQPRSNSSKNNVVLAFIVSSPEQPCTPSWGGAYLQEEAREELDLDRRIVRLRQQGGDITVSFGGLLNDELAVKCKDKDKLANAYRSVIDRYKLNTIDLDLEGGALSNTDSIKRRADVLAKIQAERKKKGLSLAVWVTLPVSPQGLTQQGTDAVAQMLSSGLNLAGVNIMTFDYGNSLKKGQTLRQATERALIETHRQLGILYTQANMNLSSSTLWLKLGATPMIGQNDIVGEVFTQQDARDLNSFAISKGLARISMWSANRDVECSDNYANLSVVSDSCSGVKQNKFEYADILSKGLNGTISNNASLVTTKISNTRQKKDDPKDSPYPIWTKTNTYLKGSKVVLHQNVYKAKWWTKGDSPDNPILQSWESPWQLIGPVLPGEKPIPQPTLPKDIYSEWSGTKIYNGGERVLFQGTAYEAKWWTQGDSPAASSSNPDSSPWTPLNREQLKQLTETINKRR